MIERISFSNISRTILRHLGREINMLDNKRTYNCFICIFTCTYYHSERMSIYSRWRCAVIYVQCIYFHVKRIGNKIKICTTLYKSAYNFVQYYLISNFRLFLLQSYKSRIYLLLIILFQFFLILIFYYFHSFCINFRNNICPSKYFWEDSFL